MNRPFYAFGVLLAFLVLAMLAVGLSSRPTRGPIRADSGSGLASPRRGLGGAMYLLVVPDDAAAHAADTVTAAFCDQPTYAEGCGLDRATGRVYAAAAALPGADLKAAMVALVERPAVHEMSAALDCRSHYDRAYDAAVYGSANDRRSPRQEAIEAVDPTLTLFNSLIGQQDEQPAYAPQQTTATQRTWQYELRAMAAGFGNQLWRSAQRMGLDDEWQRVAAWARPLASARRAASGQQAACSDHSWADYEAWIASLQPRVAGWNTPAGVADQRALARRQLLQIAVSCLNHAAKTLDAVADRLDASTAGGAEERIGVPSTETQPW